MSRKLVLLIAIVVLVSGTAYYLRHFPFALAAAYALEALGESEPVQWAKRELTLLGVRGGPEIVLEADADAERRRAHESVRRDVVGMLRKARLTFNTRLIHEGVEVSVEDDEALQSAMSHLRTGFAQFSIGVEQTSNRTVRVGFSDAGIVARTQRAAEKSQKLITARASDLGMKVLVTVQPQPAGATLLVQMARADDPKRLIAFATKPGELGFRFIDDTMPADKALASAPPPNTDILYGPAESGRLPYVVERRVIVSGSDLTHAQPGFDERTNEPIVTFRFGVAGTRKFAQATGEGVGRALAVVVDGEVLAAPVIREPITGGSGQISGNFTVQSASDLAAVLRHGELPARLKVIEERAAKAR